MCPRLKLAISIVLFIFITRNFTQIHLRARCGQAMRTILHNLVTSDLGEYSSGGSHIVIREGCALVVGGGIEYFFKAGNCPLTAETERFYTTRPARNSSSCRRRRVVVEQKSQIIWGNWEWKLRDRQADWGKWKGMEGGVGGGWKAGRKIISIDETTRWSEE